MHDATGFIKLDATQEYLCSCDVLATVITDHESNQHCLTIADKRNLIEV